MANLRLGVAALLSTQSDIGARVNWLGVAALLIGAGMGFLADKLCRRLWPDQPQRALQIRLTGLVVAIVGALWAMYG